MVEHERESGIEVGASILAIEQFFDGLRDEGAFRRVAQSRESLEPRVGCGVEAQGHCHISMVPDWYQWTSAAATSPSASVDGPSREDQHDLLITHNFERPVLVAHRGVLPCRAHRVSSASR